MSVKFDMRVDTSQMDAAMRNIAEGIKADIQQSLNVAAAYTIAQIKTDLPKRTGNLRRQYMISKPSKYVRLVSTPSKYADTVEYGRNGNGRMIYPRTPHKMLTIPIKDSVLTATKAQIKKSSLDQLFRELGEPNGRTKRQIMNDVGIILCKKARMSTIKPGLHLTKKTLPKVNNYIHATLNAYIKATIAENA